MAGRTELGKPLVIDTTEYVAWRKVRRVPQTIPKKVTEKKNSSCLTPQAAEQLEDLRAQIQLLEQQKQAAELEAITARS